DGLLLDCRIAIAKLVTTTAFLGPAEPTTTKFSFAFDDRFLTATWTLARTVPIAIPRLIGAARPFALSDHNVGTLFREHAGELVEEQAAFPILDSASLFFWIGIHKPVQLAELL